MTWECLRAPSDAVLILRPYGHLRVAFFMQGTGGLIDIKAADHSGVTLEVVPADVHR